MILDVFKSAPIARLVDRSLLTFVVVALVPGGAGAWTLWEGYSSSTPGSSARMGNREFTTVTGAEACERSPNPEVIRIESAPLTLKIGERIHYDDLVIEAYSAASDFLPDVPITVEVLAARNVLRGQADWSYLEAVSTGTGMLRVSWLCWEERYSLAEIRVTR